MKRKTVGIFVCVLLVGTLIPLQTIATQNNEVETPIAGGMVENHWFKLRKGHIINHATLVSP